MLDFDAGKYAPYVWPAYGITVLIFVILIADSLLRARKWRRAVEQLEAEAGKDKGAVGDASQ